MVNPWIEEVMGQILIKGFVYTDTLFFTTVLWDRYCYCYGSPQIHMLKP